MARFSGKNEQTENRIQVFSLSVKLLIVTLMIEIKPVVTEKHHFDNRDESFLITTSWNFLTIKNSNIDAFPFESASKGIISSFEFLIDDFKPVVAEESQFE